MNKERRRVIEEIVDQMGVLKEQLESVAEEEQGAFDNLPEGIQYSERGEQMGENVSDIEEAVSNIEDVMSALQDIVDR